MFERIGDIRFVTGDQVSHVLHGAEFEVEHAETSVTGGVRLLNSGVLRVKSEAFQGWKGCHLIFVSPADGSEPFGLEVKRAIKVISQDGEWLSYPVTPHPLTVPLQG